MIYRKGLLMLYLQICFMLERKYVWYMQSDYPSIHWSMFGQRTLQQIKWSDNYSSICHCLFNHSSSNLMAVLNLIANRCENFWMSIISNMVNLHPIIRKVMVMLKETLEFSSNLSKNGQWNKFKGFLDGISQLRSTPREDGFSPTQVVFGRSLRTLSPILTEGLGTNEFVEQPRKTKELLDSKRNAN